MAVRISGGLRGGAFSDWTNGVAGAVRGEQLAGITAATDGLKLAFRQQIAGAGLGTRLGNVIGSKVYEDTPAGLVFARGTKAKAIIDSFNTGATITSANGNWLAIPTPKAYLGGRGGHRPTPAEFEQQTGIRLRLAPPRQGRGRYQFLIGDAVAGRRAGTVRGATKRRVGQGRPVQTNVVYFVLVKSVHLGRRLDFDAEAQRWSDQVPDLIDRASPHNDL